MARKKREKKEQYIPKQGFLKDRPTPRLKPKSDFLKSLEARQLEQAMKEAIPDNVRRLKVGSQRS